MISFDACKTRNKQYLPVSVQFGGRHLATKTNPDILNAARVLSPSVPVYQYPSTYFHGAFPDALLKDTFSSLESRLLNP